MDPVSRRFMWSVIESISDGRSVVLTTHSMEECEARQFLHTNTQRSAMRLSATGKIEAMGKRWHAD